MINERKVTIIATRVYLSRALGTRRYKTVLGHGVISPPDDYHIYVDEKKAGRAQDKQQ